MVHEQTMSNNMNICQTIFLMVLFSFADSTRTESIRRSPTNATQKLGESATFACEVQFGTIITMTWEFNNEIIYSHLVGMDHYPMGNTKYTVTRTGRLFNLVVKDLRYADGGEYTCLVTTVSAKAVLIVLGAPSIVSEPLNPVEGDTAVYTCRAQFGGPGKNDVSPDHYPKLRMFYHGNEGRFFNATRPTTQETPHHLIKAYNFTLEASMHDRQLICEIRTVRPVMNLTTSTSIVVEYSVRNISYEPVQKNYEVGMGITCIADSNPPSFFEWRKEATKGNPIKGNWLNITKDMTGKNFWRCTARNVVGKSIYDDSILASFDAVSDMKHPESHEGTNGVWYITFIVILTLGYITAVVAFLASCRKRSGRRREENDQYSFLPLHSVNDHLSSKLSENSKIVIEALQSKESLDEKRSLVMDAIKYNSGELILCNPKIFLEAIRKANTLIESYHYVVMLKEMADIYEEVSDKPTERPLLCLIRVICDKEEPVVLFKNQKSMHDIVKIMLHVDNNYADLKSNLLLQLIRKSEYIAEPGNALKWTKQFLSTLNLLLEKGADPTWMEYEWNNLIKEKRYTAQYHFFWVISRIILSKNDCLDSIKKILPRFLTSKFPVDSEPRGTALHALVENNWRCSNAKDKDLTDQFFLHYEDVMREVIELGKNYGHNFLDSANWQERTPLQLFLDNITLHEGILQHVIDIVSLLKSKNYRNETDEKGFKLFHFVAAAYPLFVEVPSEDGQKKIFKCLRDLKSGSEVQDGNSQTLLDDRDNNGQTPLHILASKSMDTTQNYKEFLERFVKVFVTKSNIDIQDNKGRSALHILAEKFSGHLPKYNLQMFKDLIKSLSNLSNNSIKDHRGHTVLHILVGQYSKDMSKQHLQILQKLAAIFKTTSNVQDRESRTAVHILARNFPQDVQEDKEAMFCDLMENVCSTENSSIKDREGNTALHILVENYCKDIHEDYQKIFQKLVNTLGAAVDILDNKGQTPLHILARQIFAEPEAGNNLLLIFELLASKKNVNAQDSQSFTPYGWVLKGKFKFHTNKLGKIFFKLEEILRNKGADVACSGYLSIESDFDKGNISPFFKMLVILRDYIIIPLRHNYIRAYNKDIRHYIVLDEEFLENLETKDVITSKERHLIVGSTEKSEDKQIRDMLKILWHMADTKYFAFLEVLAQEHEDLTNLLTGGKWRGVDNEARFG